MSDEYKFWKCFVICIACLIAALMCTIGGCCVHRNYLVCEMVKQGISPIEAQMSVRETETRQAEILLLIKALSNEKRQTND